MSQSEIEAAEFRRRAFCMFSIYVAVRDEKFLEPGSYDDQWNQDAACLAQQLFAESEGLE